MGCTKHNTATPSTIFIHQDLTPKQREARKLLVQEMKERTIRGEKDLMIFNGKIIKKRSRAEDN